MNLKRLEKEQDRAQAAMLEQSAAVRRIEGMLRASKVYQERLAVHWAEASARYRAAKAEVAR